MTSRSPATETRMTGANSALTCDAWLFDQGDDRGVRVEDFPHPDFTPCPDPVVFSVRFVGRATDGAGVAVRFRCAECAAAAVGEFGDDITLKLLSGG